MRSSETKQWYLRAHMWALMHQAVLCVYVCVCVCVCASKVAVVATLVRALQRVPSVHAR